MHVESTTGVARPRAFAASSALFRKTALVAAVALLAIVATGATVRLTASGLGCEHWPGCQPGHPFPEKGYHSYIEFSNRLVAFLTIVATLVSWVVSVRTPRVAGWVRRLAFGTFLGTLLQAPLGAITVYFHLNPYLVLTHLLLSLAVLGLGVVVAIEALRGPDESPAGGIPPLVRRCGLLLLAALATLVVTGTVVTASGPHPGGVDVRRLGDFQPAIWLHVRATAVFGLLFLALLAWAWRRRSSAPSIVRSCFVVLALLLAQMAVGETQYRTQLPWWLVLVHVTLAASVWASAVGLVTLLWRPLRRFGSSPAA